MAKHPLLQKTSQILLNFEELQHRLANGETEDFARLSREYSEMERTVVAIRAFESCVKRLEEAQELMKDPEFKELATADAREAEEELPKLEEELKLALLPKDEADERSAILELRPAAGGDEAGLFAAEMFDAYRRMSDRLGWKFEVVSVSSNDVGGLKEGVAEIQGHGVFARMKYESGVHRVQRVPSTETQGRIHTSTVTVAVMPQAEEVDVDIRPDDLRIDVYRASGAGGQHVNKTESAVRITHIPTGTVVAMQEERSQHKNKAKAMAILRSRIYETQRQKAHAERSENRKSQVGTGDRSERIRTYNFPQGRVTDHRIGYTCHKISEVMAGEFDEIIDALAREERLELLADVS